MKLEAINHYPDEIVHKNCKDLLKRHELKLKNSPTWELVNQVFKFFLFFSANMYFICNLSK